MRLGGDCTAHGDLISAIHKCFETFLCLGDDEVLADEEYETFLSFGKSFHAKYYKIYPEKLKQDMAFE